MDLSKQGGKYIKKGSRSISKKGLAGSSAEKIPTDSIIMSSRAPIGYLAINKQIITTNQGCKSFVCGGEIDVEYLYYYLAHHMDEVKRLGSGSTFTEVGKKQLENLNIKYPSVSAQKKIASILSTTDGEIRKTDQIIQKTEVLKQGLMNELLTKGIGHKKFKKTKLGEIPEGWEAVAVGQLCDCIVPGRNKPKSFSGNIPWITTPNIKDSRIDYKSNINFVSKEELIECGNKKIPINSVIMTCVGEFGIIAVVDQEISINQQLHAFLPSNQVTPTFLRLSLVSQKEQMYNLATKTSVPYLNKSNCNSILIAKPPIAEQEVVAKIICSIEDKVLANKKMLNQLIGKKNGLMHDIFSQKVRVNSYE